MKQELLALAERYNYPALVDACSANAPPLHDPIHASKCLQMNDTVVQLGCHLKHYVNNPSLSDITFNVEQQQIYAHAVILASRCPFFKAMFFGIGNMKEAQKRAVTIAEVSATTFISFLQYIYEDNLDTNSSTLDDIKQLLQLANRYEVKRLMNLCEMNLIQNVNVRNVVEEFLWADLHQATKLRDYCIYIMQHEFRILSLTGQLLDLTPGMISPSCTISSIQNRES